MTVIYHIMNVWQSHFYRSKNEPKDILTTTYRYKHEHDFVETHRLKHLAFTKSFYLLKYSFARFIFPETISFRNSQYRNIQQPYQYMVYYISNWLDPWLYLLYYLGCIEYLTRCDRLFVELRRWSPLGKWYYKFWNWRYKKTAKSFSCRWLPFLTCQSFCYCIYVIQFYSF